MRRAVWLLALIGFTVALAARLPAAGYTITTIDYPAGGNTQTSANGINNLGQIVGSYTVPGSLTTRHQRSRDDRRRTTAASEINCINDHFAFGGSFSNDQRPDSSCNWIIEFIIAWQRWCCRATKHARQPRSITDLILRAFATAIRRLICR